MPSIEVIEQFKQHVQSLAKENEIREALGLPPDEITPPESQLSDDLADLLGGMPGDLAPPPAGSSDLDSLLADNFSTEEDLDGATEPEEDPLAGLFDSPAASAPEEGMPNLDDLFGTSPSENTEPESETDLTGSETGFNTPEGEPLSSDENLWDLPPDLDQGETEAVETSEPDEVNHDEVLAELDNLDSEEEFSPYSNDNSSTLPDVEEFSESDEAFSNLDDLLSEDQVSKPRPSSREGVTPEDLSDDFFNTPGEEIYRIKEPSRPADDEEDEFVFDDGSLDSDFPELAGFAATKEEDVEAFDAMGEADEFQLGDFESQFGITADDHHDSDILNPAQAIEQEIEAAQKTLSLSEEEFSAVQKTLALQPLNLKLAIEELIGEKEVVFDDLNKIVRMLINGASPRNLAAAAGKILGKKIPIPAGYEKGSGEEIEKQKASLWFNIKTVMLPILRISALVTAAAAVLVLVGWNFLMKPLKAQDLYNKGLEQVKLNNGDAADDLFAQAYYYWPARDRFFQYADAFMDTGDYDRARRKYLECLKPTIRPYTDADKKLMNELFAPVLAPMPQSLDEPRLKDLIHQRKSAADIFYQSVIDLLSIPTGGSETSGPHTISGQVIFNNYDFDALMALSHFETYYGADGRDPQAHFIRSDAALAPIFVHDRTQKEALLRKGDNFLEWASALSSRERFEDANTAFSAYMQKYGSDAPITWRFVKLFLLIDDEKEILNLRNRIKADNKLSMDGEVMSSLAGWLLDREQSREEREKAPVTRPLTLEEEYGIRPSAPSGEPKRSSAKSLDESKEKNLTSLVSRSEGGGHEGGGESKDKKIEITPPYKYPLSSQPYRPDYVEDLDKLLIRCLDKSKEFPEIHYQLSRYYRRFKNSEDEKKALAAADVYFQRLEPRKLRLNNRPALRISTLNRIGELFRQMDQPMQAEKYFLDAQRYFESAKLENLLKSDLQFAQVYVNLADLYYEQTPGMASNSLVSGTWDQALKLYIKAEEAKFESPDLVYHKGVIYYEKQDFSQAVKEFFRLERMSGFRNNVNLMYAMGNALFRSGNLYAAQGYYLHLYEILQEKRASIKELDVVRRLSHRDLAKYQFVVNNNLGAALYKGSTSVRSGSREFREALKYLTTAQAMAVTLGQDLLESKSELDITAINEAKLQDIREEQSAIVAKTRRERGLVEANLKILSLSEVSSPAKRAGLIKELEIFNRIPLKLQQDESP